MPEFVTLSCPTCGASLQITEAIERFACAYCGNEHVVRRGGGIVTLTAVVERLNGIRMGTDKTAAELAIRRLKDEMQAPLGEVNRLTQQAVRADASGLLSVFQETWPGLFWKHRRSAGGQDLCFALLDELSPAEWLALIPAYQKQARSKKKTKREVVPILERLAELNSRIHVKRNQLEEQLRIVDGV